MTIPTAPDGARDEQLTCAGFGGDGTMLCGTRENQGPRPHPGFIVGGLGFLTDLNSSRLRERCLYLDARVTLEARALPNTVRDTVRSDPRPQATCEHRAMFPA